LTRTQRRGSEGCGIPCGGAVGAVLVRITSGRVRTVTASSYRGFANCGRCYLVRGAAACLRAPTFHGKGGDGEWGGWGVGAAVPSGERFRA